MATLSITKTEIKIQEQFVVCLLLTEKALLGSREVLLKSAQYFRDLMEHETEKERWMSFLVKQSNEAVFSESCRTIRDSLKAQIELGPTKSLPYARLESASNSKKKRGGLNNGSSKQSELRVPSANVTSLNANVWRKDYSCGEKRRSELICRTMLSTL